jgi:ketosteroid isomerase-like protein
MEKEKRMAKANREALKDEIIRCIKDVNHAWIDGDFIRLRDYFHENIMIVTPDLNKVGQGIDNCIKSYEGFVSRAKIFHFEETGINVDVFGKTAVAVLDYTIDYEIEKNRQQEKGKEILVLTKEASKWLLGWRLLIPVKR